MNTYQKRARLTALQIQLEVIQKRIAVHQERLIVVPSDCGYPEIWEAAEVSSIKALKGRERLILDEMGRLQGQSEFIFSAA